MPANQPNRVDWAEIKRRWDAGGSYRGISKELAAEGIKISHVAIKKRSDREHWNGEHKPVTSKVLTVERALTQDTQQAKMLVKSGIKTETHIASLLDCIARGMSPSNAAATVGIAPSTLSYWRKTDEALNEQIDAARRAYLGTREANIHDAGDRGDLRANLAILERAPETQEYWQAKSPAGQQSGGITVNISVGDPKQVEAPTITVTPNAGQD